MSERRTQAQRSWLEVRWRQLRNPPPPVLRAVLANLAVASVGGLLLLAVVRSSDPAGHALAAAIYTAAVVLAGSLFTYLWVELPSGSSLVRRRSAWAAVLGFFASLPICYLGLVVVFQVLDPLLR